MTIDLDIRREPIDSPAARELILALNAELTGRYNDPRANHFRLDPEEVSEGRGAFFVARLGGAPVACGAVRLLSKAHAEIKRMYVVPGSRGLGLGRAVLTEVEREARALGARRLVLETGGLQSEALGLYTSAGFRNIPPFGEYTGSRTSICMEKDLYMDLAAANKSIVTRWYEEMWNQWRFDLADSIVAVDIEFRGSLGITLRGRDAFLAYMELVRRTFPDFHNHVDQLVAEGDAVVAKLLFSGTQEGEFRGIPPTHRRVSYAGVAIFRIENGVVQSCWVLGDVDDLRQQL